jgi:hypothetical protein
MAEEEKNKVSKQEEEVNQVTESETIVWLLFLLGVDGVCIILDLTGVGIAVAPFVQGAGTFCSTLWFDKAKGDKGATKLQRQLIKYISNVAPLLPTLSIVFLIERYMHNHPEKFEKLNEALDKIPDTKTPVK